jgi:hypothetical protein
LRGGEISRKTNGQNSTGFPAILKCHGDDLAVLVLHNQ